MDLHFTFRKQNFWCSSKSFRLNLLGTKCCDVPQFEILKVLNSTASVGQVGDGRGCSPEIWGPQGCAVGFRRDFACLGGGILRMVRQPHRLSQGQMMSKSLKHWADGLGDKMSSQMSPELGIYRSKIELPLDWQLQGCLTASSQALNSFGCPQMHQLTSIHPIILKLGLNH